MHIHDNGYSASVAGLDGATVADDDTFDANGIVKDGKRIRVPMVLMDSVQQGIAAAAAERQQAVDARMADARTRLDDARIAAGQAFADGVARHVERLEGADMARKILADRDPRTKAYDAMCAELQAGSRFGN